MQIKRIRLKKGQRMDLSQTKKIQNIVKSILKNKIKQIEKNTNLLQNVLTQVKKIRTRNWVEINDNIRGTYSPDK